MKRWLLMFLILAVAAGSVQAEQLPAASACESVFLWLAAGISSARIERLLQSAATSAQAEEHNPCLATTQCVRALQRAGADASLLQSLGVSVIRENSKPASQRAAKSSQRSGPAAATPDNACGCAGPAAQIAALLHDGNLEGASEAINSQLRESHADDPQVRGLLDHVLGTVLRRQDRFDDALDAFTESSRLEPGFAETHDQLSYLFYRTEDSASALAEARTALSIDPANAEGYRFLGLALYADAKYDAALHAFNEAIDREPAGSSADADVYFDMGITQRDQGDLRRAAIAYRHALALRPDFWEAHSNLGVVLHDQGKLDEAVAEYRIAKRLKPDEISVRNNLGNTLCDKSDFDGAIAELKDVYNQTPEWEGGHNCLARAYMSKQDYPSAIRELRAASAANPAGAAERRVLGQALILSGKNDEAIDALRQAIALNPQSGQSHHYLGTALANTQQFPEAQKEFREALRLEPSAQNHYSLAACLMALDKYEEALGELEIASRMDPSENLYRARMQEVVRLITAPK